MATVTIYRFSVYDIRSEELVLSRRWGTLEAITRIGGLVVEASAFEADKTSVESDVIGLTEVGFTPPTSIVRSVANTAIDRQSIVA